MPTSPNGGCVDCIKSLGCLNSASLGLIPRFCKGLSVRVKVQHLLGFRVRRLKSRRAVRNEKIQMTQNRSILFLGKVLQEAQRVCAPIHAWLGPGQGGERRGCGGWGWMVKRRVGAKAATYEQTRNNCTYIHTHACIPGSHAIALPRTGARNPLGGI